MVEKINALCNAIDTLTKAVPNSGITKVAVQAWIYELEEMLVAECKKMVNPPTVATPTTRSAQAEDMWGEKAAEDIFPANPKKGGSDSWIANDFR